MIRSRSLAAVVAICVASIALTTSPASAKKIFVDTSTMLPSERMEAASHAINYGEVRERPRHSRQPVLDANGGEARIVSHPAGCPHRLFCGCGVSLKVFGKAVVRGGLALAANWLKFPRAAAADGMVAARSGHVMYIEKYLGNNTALVYDPNSGGHQTRIHVRSLAGYRIVNPHAGQYAALSTP